MTMELIAYVKIPTWASELDKASVSVKVAVWLSEDVQVHCDSLQDAGEFIAAWIAKEQQNRSSDSMIRRGGVDG